jgi:hypothetical protein
MPVADRFLLVMRKPQNDYWQLPLFEQERKGGHVSYCSPGASRHRVAPWRCAHVGRKRESYLLCVVSPAPGVKKPREELRSLLVTFLGQPEELSQSPSLSASFRI